MLVALNEWKKIVIYYYCGDATITLTEIKSWIQKSTFKIVPFICHLADALFQSNFNSVQSKYNNHISLHTTLWFYFTDSANRIHKKMYLDIMGILMQYNHSI